MLEVQFLPLVPHIPLPAPAPARTREHVPPGYGVQEQCLPFTAASSLGLLISSPITFGLCPPGDVPSGGHTFRSPLDQRGIDGQFADDRVFYVLDEPRLSFIRNAFSFEDIELPGPKGIRPRRPLEPGISFFDRPDQQDLFKVHLPYLWRTPLEVDTLFLPAINRPASFSVLAGLVETDWYANPVNLVIHKPSLGQSLHVRVGDPIAQAVFIARSQRRPRLTVLPSHARVARDLRNALLKWYKQHAEDRSAYKKLARNREARL